MSPPVDNLLREVEEDLRRERYSKLWKKYGTGLIVVVVAVITSIAGYELWRGHVRSASEAASLRFEQAKALASGNLEVAAREFASIAADAPRGYALLGQLREAGLLAQQGDLEAAAAVYRRIARGAPDPLYRDLALLLEVKTGFAAASGAGTDLESLSERLAPLTRPDNPWRFSARELQAMIALNAGDRQLARSILADIADDPLAPPDLRVRAGELVRQVERG